MSALPAAPSIQLPSRPALRVLPGGTRPRPASSGIAPATSAQAWRRRVGAVLVLASMLVLLVVGVMSVAGTGAASVDTVPASTATVVVEPGQTLWGIASAHAPSGTPTDAYVAALIEANGLTGPTVPAWQVLVLPAG